MNWKLTCVVAVALWLGGCNSIPPTNLQKLQAYYGPRPTPGAVKEALDSRGALTYERDGGRPVHGYAEGWFGWQYGWTVKVRCRGPFQSLGWGRYQPTERWEFLFRDGKVRAAWVERDGGWKWRVP